MSKFSVLAIAKAVITALEELHSKGYTHNDIKPDNILMKNKKLTLIDFGCSTQFMESGRHIGKNKVPHFQGNYMFSSINQMTFTVTSRKDDLVSLCYLLIYLLNGRKLFGDYTGYSDDDQFELLK